MHGDVGVAEVAHVQALQLHPAQLCDAREGYAAGAADGEVLQRARLAADAAQNCVIHPCTNHRAAYELCAVISACELCITRLAQCVSARMFTLGTEELGPLRSEPWRTAQPVTRRRANGKL